MPKLRAHLFALGPDGAESQRRVHQDLSSLRGEAIALAGSGETVVIHVGFGRPSADGWGSLVAQFEGRVLLTRAAKYVLEQTGTEIAGPVAELLNEAAGPPESVFLICSGWGYALSSESVPLASPAPVREAPPSPEWHSEEPWILSIPHDQRPLLSELQRLGAMDDHTYVAVRHTMPTATRDRLDLIRFRQLSQNFRSPSSFDLMLRALPHWLLASPVQALPTTVRVGNVLSRLKIAQVGDLMAIGATGLLRAKHFGKTSLSDLHDDLLHAASKLPDSASPPPESPVERAVLDAIGDSPSAPFPIPTVPASGAWEAPWIPQFLAENEEGFGQAAPATDSQYLAIRQDLSADLASRADAFRFSAFVPLLGGETPLDRVVLSLPRWLVETELEELDLSLRARNGLRGLSDQRVVGLGAPGIESKLLGSANFGRSSLSELKQALLAKAEAGPRTKASVLDSTLLGEFARSLALLDSKSVKVLERRYGGEKKGLTLEQIGAEEDVTRERIRQIQVKAERRLARLHSWGEVLVEKLESLLEQDGRTTPLYVGLLAVEDPWFAGIDEKPHLLREILRLYADDGFRIVKIGSRLVVCRITQGGFQDLVRTLRSSLEKRVEDLPTRSEVSLVVEATARAHGVAELSSALFQAASGEMVFGTDQEGTERLMAWGRGASALVTAVLQSSAVPLHFEEVDRRVSARFGRASNVRRTHAALPEAGAFLFERGVYGFERHNPVSAAVGEQLRQFVEERIAEGATGRQWHCKNLLVEINEEFGEIEGLNHYLLDRALRSSTELQSLGRLMWCERSTGSTESRIDVAEATARLLLDSGAPLSPTELRTRLKEVRGIASEQIRVHESMVKLGPRVWGLKERDLGLDEGGVEGLLSRLSRALGRREKGLHHSEMAAALRADGRPLGSRISGYAIYSLATRDSRFRCDYGGLVGLASWEGVRRENFSKALDNVLSTLRSPQTAREIAQLVEARTERPTTSSRVSNQLCQLPEWRFDPDLKAWAPAGAAPSDHNSAEAVTDHEEG
mgnify:CR=1 FL=1